MNDLPVEVALIERLAAAFPRSPLQYNARHESDAELVRLPGTDLVLAVTTDALVEEIDTGLYADPFLIGWMSVTANASDLAAVGAEPLGLLLSETLPGDARGDTLDRLQQGVADACRDAGLPMLGGDTNTGARLALAGTALGIVRGAPPLTRCGAVPGDRLFASGPLGHGAAFAFQRLSGATASLPYRPRARLAEGQLLRGLASACMDTSDGALATLDELMRLNLVGFEVTRPLGDLLRPDALTVARWAGLPAWTLLAPPHGEFELLFTIPPTRLDAFHVAAAARGWKPLELGQVTAEAGLRIAADDGPLAIDTRRVRDLFLQVGGDVQRYVAELVGGCAAPRRSVPR